MSSFNPYVMWLGLDEQIRNPNHYQLLGVGTEERDPCRLDAAARRQLAKLNSAEPGERYDELESLRKRVKEAYSVLTQIESRAAYDKQLYFKPEAVNQEDWLPPQTLTAQPRTEGTILSPGQEELSDTSEQGQWGQEVASEELLPPGSESLDVRQRQSPVVKLKPPAQFADLDPPVAKPADSGFEQ